MFTKKFLDSNFTPLSVIASRQKKKLQEEARAEDKEESLADSVEKDANAGAAGMLSRHRGKLAVGAAAMLGIAAFYHWRESKLAKEDEEEYARLQRLKAALDADEPDR